MVVDGSSLVSGEIIDLFVCSYYNRDVNDVYYPAISAHYLRDKDEEVVSQMFQTIQSLT